jgi:hypothetical protein
VKLGITLREEYVLRRQNSVLRKIRGLKGKRQIGDWNKQHNELHTLHSSGDQIKKNGKGVACREDRKAATWFK